MYYSSGFTAQTYVCVDKYGVMGLLRPLKNDSVLVTIVCVTLHLFHCSSEQFGY